MSNKVIMANSPTVLALLENAKVNLDSFSNDDFVLVKDTPLGDMRMQKDKLFDAP